MNCEKCDEKLLYGSKYCNNCGEKMPENYYESEYNKTVWGKLDWAKDKYDTFFLKKITGSVIFKAITIIALLIYLFVNLYGNFKGIRLLEDTSYKIEYNKAREEYYISPEQSDSQIKIYVPFSADKIVFTEKTNDSTEVKEYTVDEYEKNGYTIREGQFEYILVDAVQKGKVIDSIKIIVVGE